MMFFQSSLSSSMLADPIFTSFSTFRDLVLSDLWVHTKVASIFLNFISSLLSGVVLFLYFLLSRVVLFLFFYPMGFIPLFFFVYSWFLTRTRCPASISFWMSFFIFVLCLMSSFRILRVFLMLSIVGFMFSWIMCGLFLWWLVSKQVSTS